MSGSLIFNNINSPIYTKSITKLDDAINAGKVFFITTGSQTVAANEYILLKIANPSSTLQLYLLSISGSSSFNTISNLIIDGTFSGGTSVSAHNSNTNYPDNSIIAAQYIIQSALPQLGGNLIGSFAQTSGVVKDNIDGLMIISPGHSLIISIQEADNRKSAISINASILQF